MRKLLLLLIALLFAATSGWAQTTYVGALGTSGGWYSDDTRDATGADLVGSTLTHYGKPGKTPTTADDIIIGQQISFVAGPDGVSALKMDKTTTSGASKCTMSKVNESGFATGESWLSGFFCNYRYYTNSTAEVTVPKIGIQSTAWGTGSGQSQEGFTASKSGESVWDIVLVDWRGTNPSFTVGSWAGFTTDKNTVCWRIYLQSGNSHLNPIPVISLSLQQIHDDATWGPLIFGDGAKVTSFQFGVGSSTQTSTSYIDYVETNLLNGGNRVDFIAPPTPTTKIFNATASSLGCGYIDVPVKVQGFTNVGAISLVLNYDEDVLELQPISLPLPYVGVTLNGAISSAVPQITEAGQFRLAYFGDGITLDDNAVLFTLHFKLLSGSSATTNLTWSMVEHAEECQYAGPGGTPVYVGSFVNNMAVTIPERPVKNMDTGFEYCTIQEAIDASATLNGHTITVAAGTYPEDIIVGKSITLLGPKAAIDGCDDLNRGSDEAIVVPFTNAVGSGEIFHVAASNVTIKGFTIDGDNPSLPVNGYGFGVDMHAAEGITVYETAINNLTVENNILKNLSYFGVTLYDYPAGLPSSGHVITHNKFLDLGTYVAESGNANWGGGVLLYNNQYTAVTDNCMTNVRIGIQTGNFYRANPGAPASQVISGNTIAARKRGIFHNLFYGTASPYTLSNNNISGLANDNETTFWDGILLSSMSTGSTANGNIINGSNVTNIPTTGIAVWNCQVAPLISTGTISAVGLGINVNNFESYPSTGSDAGNTSATIDGVVILAATIAGVMVHDNQLNTNGATASVVVQNNTMVTGTSGAAFLVKGASASLIFGGAAPQATITGTPKYIVLQTNGTDVPSGSIDATAVVFNAKLGSAMSLSELFATEDKIDHKIDLATLGFVLVKAGNDYVTPNSFVAPNTTPLIQRGIDAASATFTVNIQDGLYKESNINVDKALNILGQSREGVILSPSVVDGHVDDAFTNASQAFIVRSSDVNIQKLRIDGNANTGLSGTLNFRNGVITDKLGNYSNITASDVTFNNLFRRGVCIYTLNGHATGMLVSNNSFENIGNGLSFESGAAVMVFDADAGITGNTITNCGNGIGTNYLSVETNAGLFTITGNTISVGTSMGIGLDISGMKGGSMVSGNVITQGFYGIVPEYTVDAGTTPVTISNNIISGVQYGIYLYELMDVLSVLNNSINGPSPYAGSRGIYFANTYAGETHGATAKAHLEGNTIVGYEIGVDLGLLSTGTLMKNSIYYNGTGIKVHSGGILTNCANNFIVNNNGDGVLISADAGAIGAISENSLAANTLKAVNNLSTPTVLATCNNFGFYAASEIASIVSGNVTYSPWLMSAVDNEPSTPGFQPVPGSCSGAPTVSGTFKYYDSAPSHAILATTVVSVTLVNTAGGTPIGPVTTSGGTYTFTNVLPGTYNVQTSTERTLVGGINATDAAQVNFWSVSPYTIEKVRFYAGDVTGDIVGGVDILDNKLLANDAGRIQRYFLQAGTPAFARTPWTFWKAGDPISANPGAGGYPSITVGSSNVIQDFYGLVTGDFNGSYTGTKSAAQNLDLFYGENTVVSNNTEFELPVTVESDMQVGAVSMILDFPADQVSVEGVYLGSDSKVPVQYAVLGNELRISWYSMAPVSVTTGERLVTLKLRTLGSASQEDIRFSLVSNPLNELADADYKVIRNAELRISVVKANSLPIDANPLSHLLALANYPNPFSGLTNFAYTLPVKGKVILEIRDMLGRKVQEVVNQPQTAGYHSFMMNADALSSGMYYATIRLIADDTVLSQTIKIVNTK